MNLVNDLTSFENDIVNAIIDIIKSCGGIMLDADRNQEMVSQKDGRANFVTTYDKMVQDRLFCELGKLLPDAVFVGEEEDTHPEINKGYSFIIDPIDGTTNFIKDYHTSCISVALLNDGKQYMGFVYNPYLDEMFYAVSGCGAYLNGRPIKVSDEELSSGIVLFGTAPYHETLSKASFEKAYEYFNKALDIRRSGSAAIDLCSIAAGRAELYFELLLSPWDYAAGSLIVREAGGVVTTMDNEELSFDKGCSILATNKKCRE